MSIEDIGVGEVLAGVEMMGSVGNLASAFMP
jgi:hypothetical protein